MAGLDLGNLLGAAAQATTALSKGKSLKSFIETIDRFGIQVKNNFEVNFSGLEGATFFVQSIDIPQTKQNMTSLDYDGRAVDVPINFDWDHDFSMTVLNDAQGYIYSALTNFVMGQASSRMANSGYTMTVQALTGDKDYSGALVTMRGVRLVTVSGLQWDYSANDKQVFTVGGKLVDYTYTPGALKKAAGFIGAAEALLGG